MRRLEELSLGQRVLLTLAIVVALLLALALIGYLDGRWDVQAEPAEPLLYEGIPPDAELLQLDKVALDEAYVEQAKKLFQVWLSSQAGDATQFRNGMRIARRAYHHASAEIAKRLEAAEKAQEQQR